MKKFFKTFISLFVLLNVSTSVFAATYTCIDIVAINNNGSPSSYVISKEKLRQIGDELNVDSQIKRYGYGTQYKKIQDYNKRESWLMEHDIISSDSLIRGNENETLAYDKFDITSIIQKQGYVDRQNFLMTLCKAAYGVQESRPIAFRLRATAPVEYPKKDLVYVFLEGKWGIFISPNVYELYFTTLLDKNIISIKDFSNLTFIKEYRSLKTTNVPSWQPDLGVAKIEKDDVSDALGQTFFILRGLTNQRVFVNYHNIAYLKDNHITKLQALKYIEQIMRINEDDMTKKESDLVNYKFGVDYLLHLDNSTQETLRYLIAKGILDFEDQDEFKNLYADLSYDDFLTFIYRLANKSARKDFSTVQLTDSDNYWLSKGLQSASVSVFDGVKTEVTSEAEEDVQANAEQQAEDAKKESDRDAQLNQVDKYNNNEWESLNDIDQETTDESESEGEESEGEESGTDESGTDDSESSNTDESNDNGNNGVYGTENTSSKVKNIKPTFLTKRIQKYYAKEGYNNWIVTLQLDNADKYLYKNTPVGNLKAGSPKEVEEVTNNGGYTVIKFKVSSPTQYSAMAVIKNSFTMTDGDNVQEKVDSVCKVEDNDGNVSYYIPKSKISSIGNEIAVINDKYLLNTKTNTPALLLDDDNLALIGNEIVSMDKNSIKGVDGEVYYNLEIITRLMSNAYMDKFWTGSVFKGNRYSTQNDPNTTSSAQQIVDIKSTYSNENFDYGMANVYKGLKRVSYEQYRKKEKYNNSTFERYSKDKKYNYGTSCRYISMLHSTRALNVLYKKIVSATDPKNDVYMLVRWDYGLPNGSTVAGVNNQSYYTKSNPNVEEMEKFLFTRPSDGTMADYWDRNIGLSNALCNYMYNSHDVQYMNSGYAVPKVYFLSQKDLKNSDLEGYLEKMPFESDFKEKYASGHDLLNSLFEKTKTETSRSCTFLRGYKSKDVVDYQGFVLDKTGVIYASIGSDGLFNDMSYSPPNSQQNQSSNACVNVATRKSTHQNSPTIGSEYTINGDTYIYYGTTTKGSDQYYEFQSKSVQQVKYKVSGKYVTSLKVGSKKLSEWYKENVIKGYTDSMYYNAKDEYSMVGNHNIVIGKEIKTDSVHVLAPFSSKNNGKYDAFVASDYDSAKGIMKAISSKSLNRDKNNKKKKTYDEIHFSPRAYLKVGKWVVKKGSSSKLSEMVNQSSCTFLSRPNLTGVNLASGVIDSVILKCYKTVTVSDIPNDTTVYIGDMAFKAKGGILYSSPQTNAQALSTLSTIMYSGKTSDIRQAIYSTLAGMFDGAGINYVNSNRGIDGAQALVDFIQTDSGGNLRLNICNCLFDLNDKQRVLTGVGGSYYITTKGNKKIPLSANAGTFNSFCFSIAFDKNVRFRPLDKKGKTYSIVYATTKYGNGNLSNIPFNTASLDYDWSDELDSAMGTTEYQPAKFASQIMDKIKQAYEISQKNSLKALLSTIIVYGISFLIVMQLVTLACKKSSLIMYYLKKIYEPNNRGMSGIDLIKVFTLGFDSIENPTTIYKTLGVMGTLVIILSAFIHVMY